MVGTISANAAGSRVAKAVRLGLLPRLDGSVPCTDCGKPAKHYDHSDYRRPLDVQPVCSGCNKRRGPSVDTMEERAKLLPLPMLTAKEAAERLAVSESTVRRLIAYGDLPHIRVGRSIRVSRDHLKSLESEPCSPPS